MSAKSHDVGDMFRLKLIYKYKIVQRDATQSRHEVAKPEIKPSTFWGDYDILDLCVLLKDVVLIPQDSEFYHAMAHQNLPLSAVLVLGGGVSYPPPPVVVHSQNPDLLLPSPPPTTSHPRRSQTRTKGECNAHANATVTTASGNVVAKYTRSVSRLIADRSCILKMPDTTLKGMKKVASQVRRPMLRASLMALRVSSTAMTAVTTEVRRSMRDWYSSR